VAGQGPRSGPPKPAGGAAAAVRVQRHAAEAAQLDHRPRHRRLLVAHVEAARPRRRGGAGIRARRDAPAEPPSTVFAAFNAYGGPKDIRVWPYNGHDAGAQRHELEKFAFLAGLGLAPD
jgi:hypothetical protein